MLQFNNLDELKRALNLETSARIYREQEETEEANEQATGPPRPPPKSNKEKALERELKELRAERLRQQVERERRRVEQERQRAEQAERQRRSDNKVYLISILATFGALLASVVLFLVIILKF